ncbi:MAG: hypothetical protein Kow0029_02950 [Candidatus Rifleibacteriota bacterium]
MGNEILPNNQCPSFPDILVRKKNCKEIKPIFTDRYTHGKESAPARSKKIVNTER